ncbi:MAG: MATE family efflux transporter [Clostridia bacterium]|nr:MATE family efflux transporter [Clostridia bacterium]
MLFSRKDLTKLLVPLFFEQALTIAVGTIDTIMVAQAGDAAVSGVSLVDSVNTLFLYFIGAMTTGGAIVLSHAIGAKDESTIQNSKKQLMWLATIVSAIFAVVTIVFRKGLLSLIFGSVTPEIMKHAQDYFLYTSISLPFLGFRNAIGANYRAFGNTKISLYVSLITNLVNVAGNAYLIFVLHMGAAGAAIATLFSRIVGAAVMYIASNGKQSPVRVEKLLQYKPDWHLIRRMLGVGIPSGFENSVFQLGRVITQSLISTLGPVAIAANAAANSLTKLMYVPGAAVGQAMTTVVGQCMGANEKKQAKSYAIRLVGVTYAVLAVFSLTTGVFAEPLVGMFNLTPESTRVAVNLMIFHNICVSILHPMAFTLPNSFRAAGDVRFTMVFSILSMLALRVGCSFLFANTLGFGVYGVWLAMTTDWLARAIMFGIRYLCGTWLTKKV